MTKRKTKLNRNDVGDLISLITDILCDRPIDVEYSYFLSLRAINKKLQEMYDEAEMPTQQTSLGIHQAAKCK
jgi:hypothetical protein